MRLNVVSAKAETHIPEAVVIGPRFRGDDSCMSRSHLQVRNIDPAPLLPAPEPGLGELHALGAFGERPFERRAFVEMADEDLPFGFEAVVVVFARHLAPGLEE